MEVASGEKAPAPVDPASAEAEVEVQAAAPMEAEAHSCSQTRPVEEPHRNNRMGRAVLAPGARAFLQEGAIPLEGGLVRGRVRHAA